MYSKFFYIQLIFIFAMALISAESHASSNASKTDYFSLSLEQLANIKVITSSRREQLIEDSYANISVITKEMIARRGYRNLIEILEDLPGFDFSTYEDGGGEYPVHFLNRGIGGDNGNSKLLVMVDGLVQNHISFNWAQGLTDEQIIQDIERIEVVQGPGSSLYGAQAVSGIVHIITRKKFKGFHGQLSLGENNTHSLQLFYGNSINEINYQLALKTYLSDGDNGIGRPDPGNYFSQNVYPDILLANYNENGQFETNVPHPLAGQKIPDGFNTSKEDQALRLKISKDNMQLGINYWNKKDGLGSYVVGYEYHATASDFITHHNALTIYLKNQSRLIKGKLNWKSDLWYRVDKQESDTGFRYTYRFHNLKKSYHSASSQIGFENQLDWQLSNHKTLTLGARLLGNRQTEQVISLGEEQNGSASTTNSSWDIAVAGNGLGQEKINQVFDETEIATYLLLEGNLTQNLSYSIGDRFSRGSDYGSTHTPRLGLIYRPAEEWIVKALYGAAFRQPSLFELHDEFRGYSELTPEKIDTFELQIDKQLATVGNMKFNLFYSRLEDSISLIEDPSSAGGERYANIDSSRVRGFSTQIDLRPLDELTFYGNYIFQQGTNSNKDWGEISHTAKHKVNIGFNWRPLEKHFNVNFRVNYVGQRKTPATNQFFTGKAPAYTKLDLVFSWTNLFQLPSLTTQLTLNNLLDESYYGVGRQAGSSLRDEYNPATNPDPAGFIPAYHPQPGRTIYWSLSYHL